MLPTRRLRHARGVATSRTVFRAWWSRAHLGAQALGPAPPGGVARSFISEQGVGQWGN